MPNAPIAPGSCWASPNGPPAGAVATNPASAVAEAADRAPRDRGRARGCDHEVIEDGVFARPAVKVVVIGSPSRRAVRTAERPSTTVCQAAMGVSPWNAARVGGPN